MMQAHHPAMTETQTGTFQCTEDLNGRVRGLRLEGRLAGEVAQLFQGVVVIEP